MGCVKLQILDEYYKISDLKVRYKGKELTLKSCSETSCSGLINMNGRMYDPVISRMLSPDKFVQDPYNAQSYNKYSYVLNNPLKYTDKSGWFIDDYGLFKNGQIKKLRDKPEDNFDKLIVMDENGNETNNFIKVFDRSILPDLAKEITKEYKGNFAVTNSLDDAFKVFKFAADNSIVEWGIDGYRTNSGKNEYFVGTSHNIGNVSVSYTMKRFNELNMIFDMHSHPGKGTWEGTRGASPRDMTLLGERYKRFQNAGMDNSRTWFNIGNSNTIFPKHYLYHKRSNNLYYYNTYGQNNVFIRNVTNSKGLYYNLGF